MFSCFPFGINDGSQSQAEVTRREQLAVKESLCEDKPAKGKGKGTRTMKRPAAAKPGKSCKAAKTLPEPSSEEVSDSGMADDAADGIPPSQSQTLYWETSAVEAAWEKTTRGKKAKNGEKSAPASSKSKAAPKATKKEVHEGKCKEPASLETMQAESLDSNSLDADGHEDGLDHRGSRGGRGRGGRGRGRAASSNAAAGKKDDGCEKPRGRGNGKGPGRGRGASKDASWAGVGGDDCEDPATAKSFARRKMPTQYEPKRRFIAIRGAFNAHVRPHIAQYPGKHEDGG